MSLSQANDKENIIVDNQPASAGSSRKGSTLFKYKVPSPIGDLICVADSDAVYALEFARYEGQKGQALMDKLRTKWNEGHEIKTGKTAVHDEVMKNLRDYFDGSRDSRLSSSIPINYQIGTDFQRLVWDALLKIPVGETRSYSEIATAIGRPSSSRAVANAIGQNPIGIIIPCHRVIHRDGSLGGFAGGIEKKRALIDLERKLYSYSPLKNWMTQKS